MRIEAITDNPKQLQNALDKAFKEETLKTWSIVKGGDGNEYYTHTGQWKDRALIKPNVEVKKLTFHVTWWTGKEPSEDDKGYYIGRFTEVLMVHLKNYFTHLITFA